MEGALCWLYFEQGNYPKADEKSEFEMKANPFQKSYREITIVIQSGKSSSGVNMYLSCHSYSGKMK